MAKSWQEKLRGPAGLPKQVLLDEAQARRYGAKPGARMLVPAPREVYELIESIPKGRLVTLDELRRALALRHDADLTCPLTTGIFLRVAAMASLEINRPIPYWRVLRANGAVLSKLPNVEERLRAEGYTLERQGKALRVIGFQTHLLSAKELLGW